MTDYFYIFPTLIFNRQLQKNTMNQVHSSFLQIHWDIHITTFHFLYAKNHTPNTTYTMISIGGLWTLPSIMMLEYCKWTWCLAFMCNVSLQRVFQHRIRNARCETEAWCLSNWIVYAHWLAGMYALVTLKYAELGM